jgi:hypothetical protein
MGDLAATDIRHLLSSLRLARACPNDRAGLERLCRYVLRPPFAQERLRLRADGRVALELKRHAGQLDRR